MDDFLADGGFDAAYEGAPPWDLDRPQPVVVSWVTDGSVRGRVLDVGCGTGENALSLTELGYDVVGIDAAPRAIDRAREKSTARGLDVDFRVADALDLAALEESFDSAVDSGLFHVFDDADRARYVGELHAVLHPGGTANVVCFSDREPGTWGPRRVSESELREAFGEGWTIRDLRRTRFELATERGWVHAWRLSAERW